MDNSCPICVIIALISSQHVGNSPPSSPVLGIIHSRAAYHGVQVLATKCVYAKMKTPVHVISRCRFVAALHHIVSGIHVNALQ